jgi:hypothetical protein
MKRQRRWLIGRFLTIIFVLNCFLGFSPALMSVRAQRRVIIVNAEQPNVWTLEQAHYLLAQMHRRNLDLKATGVGELDPNEINGLRFDVLRTLVEFGATFNQADRFNNSLLTRDKRADAERAIRLQNRRDQLADESITLTRDIARLERERALTKGQEDKDALSAQITELTAVKKGNDAAVTQLDNDLKTATGPTGEVKPTEATPSFDPNKLPKSSFDDAFKEVTKKLLEDFNKAPKLNASLRLDNFLQMQYEIIAKQLTLLRDEVGPDERIIFLEMPQTVNAAYDKAEKKWAQSWWQVVGYTIPKEEEPKNSEMTIMRIEGKNKASEESRNMRDIVTDAMKVLGHKIPEEDDDKPAKVKIVKLTTTDSKKGVPVFEDRTVRTIELIPRQSSLNVNDLKLRVRSGVLTAVAKTLFGFGASLNVQRQRESFSQFVQQELYSAAFGKGSREFGWTFTPMPGMDRLMSGVRTTYAVMVVPVEAEALVLRSAGCYFSRNEYEPVNFADTAGERWTDRDMQKRGCTEQKEFIVPIPGGGNLGNNDFHVDGLEYVPADKGERVTLLIYGRNFPAQLGLLVDGVPLTQSIGVAQPLIRDDSAAFAQARADLQDEKVSGRIERINANQIVAVFNRPNGKDGTQPTLTMTAPGKAKILNTLRLYINGTRNATLANSAPLFGKKPPDPQPFRIDKVEVFRSRARGYLTALISGAGFAYGQQVLVNGAQADITVKSAALLTTEFRAPSDEQIRISLLRHDDPTTDNDEAATIQADAIPNPSLLRIRDVEVVSYEAATEDEPATLVVRITGSGFTDDLKSSIGELAVRSATEAILKITNPEAAAVVIITDRLTGQQVKTIVTRKSQPKE